MPILLIYISFPLESSRCSLGSLFGFTVGHKHFISQQIFASWEIRMPQIESKQVWKNLNSINRNMQWVNWLAWILYEIRLNILVLHLGWQFVLSLLVSADEVVCQFLRPKLLDQAWPGKELVELLLLSFMAFGCRDNQLALLPISTAWQELHVQVVHLVVLPIFA